MTARETYEIAERALMHLRSKQLICGPRWRNGEVCATGAIAAYINLKGKSCKKITVSMACNIEGRLPFYKKIHEGAYSAIMSKNETTMSNDNSQMAKAARYTNVLTFVRQKLGKRSLRKAKLQAH